jgi:hypothetical protein
VLSLLASLGVLLPASHAFGLASGTFTPTAQMGTARYSPAVAPLSDGRVLIAGGFNSTSGDLDTAEIFNPATNTFSPISSTMTTRREGAVAVLLGNGRVLIAGGFNSTNFWLQSSELYNPVAVNSFSPVSDMSVVRSAPAGASLPDGKALIAGGFDSPSGMNTYRSSAEIFTGGVSNSYSSTGSMSTGRVGATGSPLPDGRVLVSGGKNGSNVLRSAEIFSESSGSFGSAGGQMTIGRDAAASAPLPDGRVLVVGGDPGGSQPTLKSAETFDPSTGTFSSAGIGAMGTPRFAAGAAPLPDGRVLVVGGYDASGQPLRTAEIFSLAPTTMSFTVQGKLLSFDAPVAGTLSVSGAGGKKAVAAKKGKRKRLLKPASASGGPGTILLKLKPLGTAKRKLRQKGKVRIPASLQFTPAKATTCVKTFTHCYSYATSSNAKLKITLKRK